MSKPTDAERRRVAARLRDAADENLITACGADRLVKDIGKLIGCKDMMPSPRTSTLGEMEDADQRFLRRLADLIEPEGSSDECVVHCKDCRYLDTMRCPVKRALVYDEVSPTAVIAPGGFCAWGEPKECK